MAAPAAYEFRIETLAKQHNRAAFFCGVQDLDNYLKTQASQDMRRKANAVFVMVSVNAPTHIIGYSPCAPAVNQGTVPEAARKHIPRYPLVSATLIGPWQSMPLIMARASGGYCWRVRRAWRTRMPRSSGRP
jgi:hypothetical protein